MREQLSKLDKAYYTLERALVVICLVLMSASVFVEVVHRRLSSRDSAVSGLVLFPKKVSLRSKVRAELGPKAPPAQVDVEVDKRMRPLRRWADEHVAPPLTGALLLLFVLFALRTARESSARQAAAAAEGDGGGGGGSSGDGDFELERGPGWVYFVGMALAAVVGVLVSRVGPGAQWGIIAGVGLAGMALSWVKRRGVDELGAAAAVCVGLVLLAKLMVSAPSKWTYVALVCVATMVMVKKALAAQDKRRAAIEAVGGLLVALIAYRYAPEGFGWSKEIAVKILLMWVAFLGASMATHTRRHIMVDFMRKAVPKRLRSAYEGISALIAAGIAGLLAYLGYLYVFGAEGAASIYGSEALLEHAEIPAWVGMMAIPVGLAISALRFVGTAVTAFRGELEERDPLEGVTGGSKDAETDADKADDDKADADKADDDKADDDKADDDKADDDKADDAKADDDKADDDKADDDKADDDTEARK